MSEPIEAPRRIWRLNLFLHSWLPRLSYADSVGVRAFALDIVSCRREVILQTVLVGVSRRSEKPFDSGG